MRHTATVVISTHLDAVAAALLRAAELVQRLRGDRSGTTRVCHRVSSSVIECRRVVRRSPLLHNDE